MLRTLMDLTGDALAPKAEGRIGEAISVFQDAVRAFPTSAVALHNLAAAYGDARNGVLFDDQRFDKAAPIRVPTT